MIATDFTGG